LLYYTFMTEKLTSTNLASQVKEDYLAYSMAILVGRAIPDLYDGMKPVQRRILQTMLEENLKPDGRYVKCARVTGLAMAFYHPHGGAYGPLVNMATPWNNNVPWIDGHGNFGSSVDGPAAERYTECKLRPSAVDLLLQNRETWETAPNYDGSRQEAVRFNTAVPSVLLNGDTGIAVGFATKLAPHNLRDVVEATKIACKFEMTDKESSKNVASAKKLLLPDFPSGCDIVRDDQLDSYAETGSGSIRCRARHESGIQKRDGRAKDRPTITFTNLPPGVNPEKLGEQIRDGLEKGKIEGVAEVIDESDLAGDRLTVVAKPGIGVELLTKQLYAYTDLDTKYSAKTLVIDNLRPVELSPVEVCQKWFKWRMDRLEVQFAHERDLKEARLEIVTGLIKAISKIDAVIKVIRAAKSHKEALIELVSNRSLKFTADQARAILDMRLRQLTNLDVTDLETEKKELEERLDTLHDLLTQPSSRAVYTYKQITEIAKRHGEKRRCQIIDPPDSLNVARQPGQPRVASAPKPRFMKIDMKKGVVEQAKGPRGALVVDAKEKVILLTEDGMLKKVAANFKGTISDQYSSVFLAKRENEVKERKYLAVFTLDDQLKAMMINGADLSKTTSKGKRALPDGAVLLHFSEGSYTVPWVSARKKKVELFPVSTKPGRPGGKGVKVASLDEVKL
jgi:DNA gyrase subunit A